MLRNLPKLDIYNTIDVATDLHVCVQHIIAWEAMYLKANRYFKNITEFTEVKFYGIPRNSRFHIFRGRIRLYV